MSSPFSPIFLIGEIRIGTISEASVMNLGNNQMSHFTNNKKQNQGFGSITGDNNTIEDIRNLLNDPDIIDMFSEVEGADLPSWLQGLIEEQGKEEINPKDNSDKKDGSKEQDE